jgi:hypothetical protein
MPNLEVHCLQPYPEAASVAIQSNCLHIVTETSSFISNRQNHNDLGIPFLVYHTRALNESFDSGLADAENSIVWQPERHLFKPRAV